jgi:rubrerythrin
MEREKVVKGLKWCMNEEHDCYREKGCPYENEGEDVGCKYALHRDVLELLKAQEPDETRLVRHYSRPNVYADLWLHCEKCGGVVDNRYRPKFCPECGRKVKWE